MLLTYISLTEFYTELYAGPDDGGHGGERGGVPRGAGRRARLPGSFLGTGDDGDVQGYRAVVGGMTCPRPDVHRICPTLRSIYSSNFYSLTYMQNLISGLAAMFLAPRS